MATLNIEMDEDAKVHWAETVDKPRYRQFTISGNPGLFGGKTKGLYEPAFYTLLLADRQVGLLGKHGKFGHGTYSDID
jgi:hypothetical protein